MKKCDDCFQKNLDEAGLDTCWFCSGELEQ